MRCVQMALWPTATRLRVEACARADSVTVRPPGAAEACDCEGIDPLSLLRDADWERISILKCDIEGAEDKLFSEKPDAWMERHGLHSDGNSLAAGGAIGLFRDGPTPVRRGPRTANCTCSLAVRGWK